MKSIRFVATVAGTRHQYEIIARSWETRNSWGHEAELWMDGRFVDSEKVRYYNRTWESWQYQSVCLSLLSNYAGRIESVLLDQYRIIHEKKRLNQDDKKRALRPVAGLYSRLKDHLEKGNNSRW